MVTVISSSCRGDTQSKFFRLIFFSWGRKIRLILLFFLFLIVCFLRLQSQQLQQHYQHYQHYQPLQQQQQQQRIVILAGPHKTGSTSMQNNILQWTKLNLLGDWSWPVPPLIIEIESNDDNNWEWNEAKGFYPLMESLRSTMTPRARARDIFQKYTKDEILEMYKSEFNKQWNMGKSLIIGSEAFDFCIKDEDGDHIFDNLMHILPVNTSKNINNKILDVTPNGRNNLYITIVVTHRSPRVKHLQSVWSEFILNQNVIQRTSFKDWLLKTKNNFGVLDSLGLAEFFMKRGVEVALVDGSGVSAKGLDLSDVVACSVLNASCSPTGERLVGVKDPPVIHNIKAGVGSLNVSKEQLDRMEEVIARYDCKYQFILKKNITLLHGEILVNSLARCKEYDVVMSRLSMKEQIVDIVRD